MAFGCPPYGQRGYTRLHGLAAGIAVAAATLLFPSVAFAHGPTAPVATSFRATVTAIPADMKVDAKVVDGDKKLSLRVDSKTTLVVLGFAREPYIRFDPAGVEINLRSPTTYLNQPRLKYPAHRPSASAPPRWKRVTAAHEYSWHENRLHALERIAHGGALHVVGRWSVPIEVDGKRTAIDGTLSYVPGPPAWAWPAGVVAGLVAFLAVVWLARRREAADALLGAVALAATLVARLGRELYGRPDVSLTSLLLAVLTCLVAVALLAGLLATRRERRRPVGLLVGGFALYQALTLVATLTNGVVLAALPADMERLAIAVALSSGVATLIYAIFGESAELARAAPRPAMAQTS
jgi:hypothetical protein